MKRIFTIAGFFLLAVITIFTSCNKSDNTTTATTTTPVQTPALAWNNSPIGVGDTLKLHAATVPGATYIWTGPGITSKGANPNNTKQNPIITQFNLSDDGDYTVTTIVKGVASAPYNTYVTDMNIVASSDSAAVGGSGQVTQNNFITGNTVGLSATSVLDIKNQVIGTAYSWKGPNNFSSPLQNPSISKVTMAAAGTYSVVTTYTDTTALKQIHTSNTATVTIIIKPAAPTIKANQVIVGGTLNLSITPASGASAADTICTWTGPNGWTSKSRNPSFPNVTRAAVGTYTCFTTNSLNNTIQSLTASIYVNVQFSQTGCLNLKFVVNKGVVYNIATIGNQCWMQEDLQNGASTNSTLFTWANATEAVAVAPQQGACPVGWHLPNDSMLQSLEYYVNYNGNTLKSPSVGYGAGIGTSPSGAGGFLALFPTVFATTDTIGQYWSFSNNGSSTNADFMQLFTGNSLISFGSAVQTKTFQIRCMKD
jgi:uncharacterized protein (TIGR02145 family)